MVGIQKPKFKEELRKIRDEVVACQKCPLSKYRKENNFYPVIGEGNHWAKIMFVGEAPGLEEAKTGHPFCGRAGKVLDRLLESIGIERKNVYIANILKCRPPGNRDPEEEEIEACVPYLDRQIDIIKPEIIGALGRYSAFYLLRKYGLEEIEGISRIHGKIFDFKNIKIVPLYHPAVATYNPGMIDILKNDFKILENFKNGN